MDTKWGTLATTQDFRFWKLQKEAGSLTLDICVGALLGIGKLFTRKTQYFSLIRNSQCAWIKNLILGQFFINIFPMQYSLESLGIKVVIRRNVFLFKGIKNYFGAFYYCIYTY